MCKKKSTRHLVATKVDGTHGMEREGNQNVWRTDRTVWKMEILATFWPQEVVVRCRIVSEISWKGLHFSTKHASYCIKPV